MGRAIFRFLHRKLNVPFIALLVILEMCSDHCNFSLIVIPIHELLVFQVIEVNCVRLGVLLLAKLNLLCLGMLTKAGCDGFFYFNF